MTRRGPSRSAIQKFSEFQGYLPRQLTRFHKSFRVPRTCVYAGKAIYEVYRSDKVDPETDELPKRPYDYIHHHEAGVKLYRCDADAVGRERQTPAWLRKCNSLVLIGPCLEWQYEDARGQKVTAEASKPFPELFCTPNGKALLVIEHRKEVVVMIWGGSLRVERRGIVG